MSDKIKIKRGSKSNLPILDIGEMAFCTDTNEVYVGSATGNILVNQENSNLLQTVDIYKTEPIGELFVPPGKYNAWCPTNLQYDKTRDCGIVLINAADSHVFTTCDQYFCTIDLKTLTATEPKKISPVDSQGNPVTYAIAAASTTFIILNDGSYMYLRRTIDTWTYARIISTDGGNTWVDTGNITVTPAFTSAYTIWGLTKLSNGRIIGGLGGHANSKAKIIISDDDGINWRVVSIGTTAPSGTCAEPCIIEYEPNRLISIARKSTSGMTYGTSGGASDPAVIAYSNDNGETWTNYKDSATIKMNAASASAYVHDGIIEVFAASRLYTTIEAINTSETGALYHYTATIENALNDNFTLKETTLYAKAADSVDFHAPCVLVDDEKRMLIMYMDETEHYGANVSYSFVRGNLGGVRYNALDGAKSKSFGYSGKYIELLISKFKTEIATLQQAVYQLSKGTTPNVILPNGTLMWTRTYNAQNKKVTLNNDPDFAGKVYSSAYGALEIDASNITYHKIDATYGIALEVTKPNFSVYFKGILNNQLKSPIAAVIIDNVVYGIISPDQNYDVKDTNVVIHDFKFEYWNGKMKAFIDDIEVHVKSAPFDSTNIIPYSALMSAIGTYDSSKKYIVHGCGAGGKVYDVKLGEWDS